MIVETTPLGRPGSDRGLGRYTRAVLAAATSLGFEVSHLSVRDRRGRTAEFRDLCERQARVWGSDHDVFHATNPHVSVAHSRRRLVTSILDIIPLDLEGYRQTGLKNRLFFSLAAKADCVLTLSPFTAQRISARLEVPEERIVIAPLPPASAFRPRGADDVADMISRLRLPTPYVAALADLRTPDLRKRHDWLPGIAARLSAGQVGLVLAGAGTEACDRRPGMRGIGRVSDGDLSLLFSGAVCFVSPSAYEGQGLPALEAMACGTPVVAMNNSSVVGVVGDGGLLIEEENDDGSGDSRQHAREAIRRLADSCIHLAGDGEARCALSSRAAAAARRFSWAAFAAGVAQAYSGESPPPNPSTPVADNLRLARI